MDLVEEIKNRLNIEDVISEYVQLKRSGSNWRGLSPFNNEKTPSFIVSPEKQIWHDFSSGRGGNMFSFVMEMEGLSFKETLNLLARKAGLDPDQFRTQNHRGQNKEKLFEILEISTKFFQLNLKNNQTALEYVFLKRKFNKKTVAEWRLGYSDSSRDSLKNFLLKRKFDLKDIKSSGLLSRYDEDMFRDRLMIPLQDEMGRVIGYTARLLNDNMKNSPKYINTPQTILYDKSRHVFGLSQAKNSLRKNKFAVMVEGNLDVIASYQAGVENVIATAGTALTNYHLKIISRFVSDIRLCFDSDRAGIDATKRAINLASKINLDVNVINLPQGKDPDELIKINPNLWINAINDKIYAVDWLINYYQKIYDVNTSIGKKNFSSNILPIIQNLDDEIEKDHYFNLLSDLLQVSKDSITKKSYNYNSDKVFLAKPNPQKHQEELNPFLDEANRLETNFLSIVLARLSLRDLLKGLNDEYFLNQESKTLFELLKKYSDIDYEAIVSKSNDSEWKNIVDYVKILSLLYDEKYRVISLEDLHYEANFLKIRLIDNYVKYQKEIFKKDVLNNQLNEEDSIKILKKIDKLNQLLNKFKE
jgi:DNA primase